MDHLSELIKSYPILTACKNDIAGAFEILKKSFSSGGKLLVCGNGGSAADCEHIVGELMKGFMLPRPIDDGMRAAITGLSLGNADYICNNLQGALPAISLVSHSALMTAFSNDVAADMIFAQQVYGYANEKDAVIGFSTSGNSKNIIYALEVARAKGAKTIGMTGETGGLLSDICDVTIKAPSSVTPHIQEYHLPIYHCLCMMLEWEFFGQQAGRSS